MKINGFYVSVLGLVIMILTFIISLITLNKIIILTLILMGLVLFIGGFLFEGDLKNNGI